jgi:hypothetical protein
MRMMMMMLLLLLLLMMMMLMMMMTTMAMCQGFAPVYQEMGPYTFKEDTQKASISFIDDGRFVTYVTQVG